MSQLPVEHIEVISKEEFERLSKNGYESLDYESVNFNAYVDPQIGQAYRAQLLTNNNVFTSKKAPPQIPPPNTPAIGNDKGTADLNSPEPFDMPLMPDIEKSGPQEEEKEKVHQPLYQVLLEGALKMAWGGVKSIHENSLHHALKKGVNNDLGKIKASLKGATDFSNPSNKRQNHWKDATNSLNSLNERFKKSPFDSKASTQAKASMAEKVNSHFFKGKESVSGKLNSFVKKNKPSFNSNDKKSMEKFSESMKAFSEQLKEIVKSIMENIKKILPGGARPSMG